MIIAHCAQSLSSGSGVCICHPPPRYQQVAHVSGSTLSALLGTLIVAMAVVWYTQLYEGGGSEARAQAKRQRKLRSTEYVD